MTKDEHKARHLMLHEALDELLADYIQHHPDKIHFLNMPIRDLTYWSFKETLDPTDLEVDHADTLAKDDTTG